MHIRNKSTYGCNISEKLPGVPEPSGGQNGGAGSQSSSHNVWIFESHIDRQHATITAGRDETGNTTR